MPAKNHEVNILLQDFFVFLICVSLQKFNDSNKNKYSLSAGSNVAINWNNYTVSTEEEIIKKQKN